MGFDFEQLRHDIRLTKQTLRAQLPDLKQRFEWIEKDIDQQIAEISADDTPVPDIQFGDLTGHRISTAQRERIKRRGCVVIRNVFDPSQVNDWNAELMRYVHDNRYFERSAKKLDWTTTLASWAVQSLRSMVCTGPNRRCKRANPRSWQSRAAG